MSLPNSTVLIYSLISVITVSLISLIGVITLSLNTKILKKILIILVSLSAGALLGDAFIHLLPELIEEQNLTVPISLFIILGILIFFIIEKFIHWRHCHVPTSKDHPHPFAIVNLIGDGLHNFIDGLVIGSSYLINIETGIATTIAVILHEIPQEIGDFGVLLHGGFSKGKALLFNFLSAATAILGTIISVYFGSLFKNYNVFLIALTIGGFIYIAASDLIPELHKEVKINRSIAQIFGIMLGVTVMIILVYLE